MFHYSSGCSLNHLYINIEIVFSIVRLLSTPFNFAHTFAAARAVLFSPNSTTEYKLLSSFNIIPRLISAVVAIMYFFIWAAKVCIENQNTFSLIIFLARLITELE